MTGVHPHVAIRASAGSGKTFQLTNRLLSLLCAKAPPDKILATTFTRKAAGEILERVLRRLADAALDDDKRAELASHIGLEAFTKKQANDLLGTVVARLHRLRICTLDSLFANIASGFTAELQLPAGWKIVEELDDERLRTEAIREVLRRGRTGDLVQLLRLLTKGETSRSVASQIRWVVDAAYSVFLATDESAWNAIDAPPLLEATHLRAAVDRLHDVVLPKHKTWERTREQDWTAADSGDWQSFLESTLAQKVHDRESSYCRVPISQETRQVYQTLVDHATADVLDYLVKQNYGAFQLLTRFHAEYQALKTASRAIRFDDVALHLSRAAEGALDTGDVDLFFRLDQRLDHVLLDEFQDTSLVQWTILRPLVEQVVAASEDRSFFCVGDAKQAIYGWRGGNAELFDKLGARLPGLEWRDLATSYRSSQPVIDVVNRVFGDLGANRVLQKEEAYVRAGARWSEGFTTHSTARTELPGYVRFIASAAPAENEDPQNYVYSAAADVIRQATLDAPKRSIGVLARKNKGVARMMEELRVRAVPASQEGGNPLVDSTAVQIVLAALRLADHPGDSAARFLVGSSPLGPVIGIGKYATSDQAARAASALRTRLVDEDYGPTIAFWVEVLAPHVGRRDRVRLNQLADLAFIYDGRATLRPSDFVELVEKRKVEEPSPALVRVMTIHQAKGLEFDVVVLPEFDELIVGQTPSFITWEDEPAGPPVGVVAYVRDTIQSLLPEKVRNAFEKRVEQSVRESLCLLYVAMTRAIHALYVVVAPSPPNERSLPRTFNGVLRAALTGGDPLEPNAGWFEAGDPHWFNRRR
jgi:ATP-dependent exoDNAse (exonuclease V) beta subunit